MEKCPILVFLMETMCSNKRMDAVRMEFDSYLAVDNVGLSGGIALLWKEDWSVRVLSYS